MEKVKAMIIFVFLACLDAGLALKCNFCINIDGKCPNVLSGVMQVDCSPSPIMDYHCGVTRCPGDAEANTLTCVYTQKGTEAKRCRDATEEESRVMLTNKTKQYIKQNCITCHCDTDLCNTLDYQCDEYVCADLRPKTGETGEPTSTTDYPEYDPTTLAAINQPLGVGATVLAAAVATFALNAFED